MVRRLYPDVTAVRLRRNRRTSARNVGPAPWRAATLVGPDGAEDPLNELLAESLLPRNGLPGPRVLGFLGCVVVTRREAFLRAGGYRGLLGIGGEEGTARPRPRGARLGVRVRRDRGGASPAVAAPGHPGRRVAQ
jgi:hypothetical protein